MSEENLYQAPDATLVDKGNAESDLSPTGIKGLPAGSGVSWIKRGFDLFKQNPLIWIVILILYFAISMVANFIPFVGALAFTLLYAVFVGGLMMGCAAQDRGEELEIAHLFAGFKSNTGSLIGVGALYLLVVVVFTVVIMGAILGSAGGLQIFTDPGSIDPAAFASPAMLLPMLVALALFVPVAMAFLFAPALVALGGQSIVNSLKMSFSGCLKNIVPFLIYGIVAFVLAIIATIPFGLGWLVLGPILTASIYAAYRDIYTG